jgi:hypothetical protein
MSEFPSRDEFSNQLNTKFRVYFDAEQPTEVELTEVSDVREKPGYTAFSIIFLVPTEIGVRQGLFKTEHDSLGAMELFYVPVGQSEKGLNFESVFNYKITASDG